MDRLNITIWVTESCNMKCRYCYETNKKEYSMTIKTAMDIYIYIKDLLDRLEIKVCNIHFHGGEPLLNLKVINFFMDKFLLLEKVKFLYSITTNGSIYNEQVYQCLKRIEDISVSIDGQKVRQDVFRKLKTNGSSYDIVKFNISRMLQDGLKITARMTCVPENIDYLEDDIMHIFKLGIRGVINSLDYWNHLWTSEQLQSYSKQIQNCKNTIKNDKEYILDSSLSDLNNKKGDCFGGIYNRVIDCDGNLYPCAITYGYKKWIIGNIYTGTDKKWRNQITELNSNKFSECIN